MISTYLFDLDDTLIDASIYGKMYKPIVDALADEFSASAVQEAISAVKLKTGRSRADTYELCVRLGRVELYYEILEESIAEYGKLKFPVQSVFEKIKENGKRIGVVSASQERTIRLHMKHFGLGRLVDFVRSGDKRNPDFWRVLFLEEKLDYDKTLLIDDDTSSIRTAKAAGIQTLQVKNSQIEGFSL